MVLRRVFEPVRKKITGGWRKRYIQEFCNLYPLQNVMDMIKSVSFRWDGHSPHMGEIMNTYRLVVLKPKGKRPLERHT
jgi:hypothetical protein